MPPSQKKFVGAPRALPRRVALRLLYFSITLLDSRHHYCRLGLVAESTYSTV